MIESREAGPQLVSSNSFRVEYNPNVTHQETYDHIVSYLGEFRFQLPRYEYSLALVKQSSGLRLVDRYQGEPMTTKAFRSVMERKALREPSHREEAELTGLTFLEQQLAEAEVGDSIIWFSPPGGESEGFGDYGFGFKGEVRSDGNGKKEIKMTANRFERPTLEQFNLAFGILVGSSFNGQNADDFLRMPIVIKGGISDQLVDAVFYKCFGFVNDPAKRMRFDTVIRRRIDPLIAEFIGREKDMSISERVKSIHAMENIVTDARKTENIDVFLDQNQVSTLREAWEQHGHEPEKVKGSCPVKSNNPLEDVVDGSGLLEFKTKYSFDKFGHCVTCGNEAALGPCGICQPCDIKMQREKRLGMAA